MEPGTQQMLLDMDDTGFCEILLTILSAHQEAPEALLYEQWVLQRLRAIHEQNPVLFFGHFLTPLRRQFPRKVFVGDLFASMKVMAWENAGAGGMVDSQDFLSAAVEWYERKGQPGIAPGWLRFSQHYCVRAGELTLVGGQPNHYKSGFVHMMTANVAKQAGWKFGIFSPEHSPLGELARALCEAYTGRLRETMTENDWRQAAVWTANHYYPIVPPEDVGPSLAWILGVARQLIKTEQIRGLILDPWNEIDHLFLGRGQSETQYISEALSKIRRFARYHQIHVWLVAHPTKMARQEKGPYAGLYPPPSPYDIAGSSHFYAKADNILCVWRNVTAERFELEIHIQKVRYRATGKIGKVNMVLQNGNLQEVAE